EILSWTNVLIGMVIGSALGLWMARSVKMTSMPQMVALLNGFGGGASLLVASAEYLKPRLLGEAIATGTGVTIQLSILIGAVTLSGSLIAWAKLQEVMTGKPITWPGQQFFNAVIFLGIVALGVMLVVQGDAPMWMLAAVIGLA